MPKAVHDLEKKLRGKPGVMNSWALAYSIENKKKTKAKRKGK